MKNFSANTSKSFENMWENVWHKHYFMQSTWRGFERGHRDSLALSNWSYSLEALLVEGNTLLPIANQYFWLLTLRILSLYKTNVFLTSMFFDIKLKPLEKKTNKFHGLNDCESHKNHTVIPADERILLASEYIRPK